MSYDEILENKRKVIEKHGKWTSHNIHLGGGIYTMENGRDGLGDLIKLRRIVQLVADLSRRDLSDLRILDLGCLEGMYGIELALHGAKVVGVEIRLANLEKARFAKETLGLKNIEFIKEDVRKINRGQYGVFDVVLCLGILYHIDAEHIFSFLENLFDLCSGLLLIDTNLAKRARTKIQYRGLTCYGQQYREHGDRDSQLSREANLWASIDNTFSFWFTKKSLINLLKHIGFTSVLEGWIPPETRKPSNRVTLAALKGTNQKILVSPLLNDLSAEDYPEKRFIWF